MSSVLSVSERSRVLSKRLMVVSHVHTKPLIESALGKSFRSFFFHKIEETINNLKIIKPRAIISESELQDGNVWNLATAVRSGQLCSSATPIIMMSHGENSAIVKKMAEIKKIDLYTDECLDDLPRFVKASLTKPVRLKRMLVIEDDESITELLAMKFGESFSVEVAHDGNTGLSKWENSRHDLIVLDLELPGMHGLEVLERIRSLDPNQPVLVLSGYLNDDNVPKISLDSVQIASKTSLADLSVLMDRCIEALEWRNLEIMRKKEQLQQEQLELITDASEWLDLSDDRSPLICTARSLLKMAKTRNDGI